MKPFKRLHKFFCTEIDNYSYLYEGIKNSYLKNRIEKSLEYFLWNAKFYKELHMFLSVITIVLPSIATFISCNAFSGDPSWAVPAITATTAIISGLMALLKCSDKQKTYRDCAESIKSEVSNFYYNTGKYTDAEVEKHIKRNALNDNKGTNKGYSEDENDKNQGTKVETNEEDLTNDTNEPCDNCMEPREQILGEVIEKIINTGYSKVKELEKTANK